MRRAASLDTTTVVAVVVPLLLAGCAGAPSGGTPVSESPPSTATTAPLESLPSPAQCLSDAALRPEPVDGIQPSTYPEPPANTSRAAVVQWVHAFETAYFRNEILAGAGDDEMNLTSVTASAETRAVNRTADGYVVRFSDFGASNYASGIHGDHWSDVGYVVTETKLVRVPLEDRDEPVRTDAGTVVVDCS